MDDKIVQDFAALFSGRTDVWGTYGKDGKGMCIKEAVTIEHYKAHLEGKKSLGVYPLTDDNKVRFFAIDLDEKNFDKAKLIRKELSSHYVYTYIAKSKSKGYHIYGFLEEPLPAIDVRKILNYSLDKLNIKAELFPKQDKVDEKIPYGNYINLPCFGDTRPFVTNEEQPVPLDKSMTHFRKNEHTTMGIALRMIPEVKPKVIETKVPSPKKRRKGDPPCIEELLKGISEGGRDEAAFALARHYLDVGYVSDEVLGLLSIWDAKNKPPIGDVNVLETKVRSAEKGYAFGCKSIQDNANLSHLCVGKENCRWFKQQDEERKKKGTLKESSLWVEESKIYEEIIVDGKAKFAMYDATGKAVSMVDEISTPNFGVVPIFGNDVTEGAVLLPDGVENYGTTVDLVNAVKNHIHTYADMPDLFLEMAAWYVMMSWIYDRLTTLSYLRFTGDTGTGKSRCLDTVGRICYKPMMMSGAVTPAPIYRIIRRWRGTMVLDEADFSDTSEKAEVVTVLNCLAPKTKIYTDKGVKEISQVTTDDKVIGHSGNFRNVTKIMKRNYKGSIISVTPSYSNIPIFITGEHPILCKDGWVFADALILSDKLAIPKPKIPTIPIEKLSIKIKTGHQRGRGRAKGCTPKEISIVDIPLTKEVAWVLGLYIAEGCTHSGQYITFTLNSSESEKITKLTDTLKFMGCNSACVSYQNNSVHITACVSGWGQQFAEWFGEKAFNKKIPDKFLSLPKEKLVHLVKGILDGDGHQQPQQEWITLTTSSENLAWSIKAALAKLDILAAVYYQGPGESVIQGRKVKTHGRWGVRISAIDAPKLGYPVKKQHSQNITHDDDYWYVGIENIARKNYDGPVHNIAVDTDESYYLTSMVCHNCGFERGRPIIRCNKNDPNDLEILPCFGPKIMATRHRFTDAALESRCLTHTTEETDRDDIPAILGETFYERERTLRRKLLKWRFDHYFAIDPKAIDEIDLGKIEPRLKQTSLPFALAFKDLPDVMEHFKQMLKDRSADVMQERADSECGRVVNGLFRVALEQGKDLICSDSIVSYLTDKGVAITRDIVNKHVKALNLKRAKNRVSGKQAWFIVWNRPLMKKLLRRYILDQEDFKTLFEEQKVDDEINF